MCFTSALSFLIVCHEAIPGQSSTLERTKFVHRANEFNSSSNVMVSDCLQPWSDSVNKLL